MNDDLTRQLVHSLDNIQAYLAQISGQLAAQRGYTITQQGKVQSLLELLVAMTIPSAPALSETVAVPSANSLQLCVNNSQPFQRYLITNDDPAQPLWIGPDDGVTVGNGHVLMPRLPTPFVIPLGGEIWGICMAGAISVRVASGYDFVGIIQTLQG